MNLSVLTRPARAAALAACLLTFDARAAEPTAPPPDLRTLLQQALFEEEATRDLEKAAGGYEKLLSTWGEQRRYAASALFRLAEVRRKQDRKDDAVKLYQRLLTEFPEQDPETRLSRENLAALGAKAPAPAVSPGERMDPEEEKELGRLMVVAENSPSHLLDMVPWPEAGSPGDTLGVLANAARKGWIRVATWLLDHGADANESTRATPLYHAVEKENLAMCVLLFSRGANPESARGALTKAVSDNQTGIADLLLSKGVDVNQSSTVYLDPANKQGWMTIPPVVAAIARGNRAWVDRLLQAKADVNVKVDNNFTPLHAACWKEDAVLVKRLLEAGARPDVPDSLGNSLDDGQTMDGLRHGIRGSGWTPLHYAAGSAPCVKELLSRGAKPDVKDSQGISPLHVACYTGREESARLLLAAGADPNASGLVRRQPNSSPSYIGGTAFSLAIRYVPGTLVEAMLKAGAKADAADDEGSTPFHLAVGYANVPAVAAMLAAGFPADTPDKAGITPLLTALRAEKDLTTSAPAGERGDKARQDALTRSSAIVDLLLKAGADPEKRLPDKTPVYLAATPSRLRAFTRDLIYPKLAASRAIHLIWPGSRSERLAAPEREDEVPPALADALVGFDESQRASTGVPGQYKAGIQFSGLTIWRKKADGKMESLAVDTAGEGPFPAMQWGDVIELSSEKGKFPEDPLLPFRTRMERRVTVQMGEMKQELTLRGRLRVYDPSHAEVPLVSTSMLLNLLGARHPDFADATVEVRHNEAKGGGSWSWPLANGSSALPEDGDVITVKRGDPVKTADSRLNNIVLTVPGKMIAWPLPGMDRNPTLMQFFAEVYAPCFRPGELASQDAKSPVDMAAKISRMTPAEFAAKLWRADAPVFDRAVIAWPDWAHVKVHRLSGAGEEILPVNVAETMEAFKQEATRDNLPKAVLMPLQPGDIVELPVMAEHPPGPWPGFDAAAVRLFQKALEARVTIVEESGRFREVMASWIPPRWVDTPAGLLAIPDGTATGGKVRSLRASEFVESVSPGMQVAIHIRDGKKSGVSGQSGDSPESYFLSSGDVLHIKWPPKISVPGSVIPGSPPIVVPNGTINVPQPPRRRVVLPTQQ